jgi:hypothetical protein
VVVGPQLWSGVRNSHDRRGQVEQLLRGMESLAELARDFNLFPHFRRSDAVAIRSGHDSSARPPEPGIMRTLRNHAHIVERARAAMTCAFARRSELCPTHACRGATGDPSESRTQSNGVTPRLVKSPSAGTFIAEFCKPKARTRHGIPPAPLNVEIPAGRQRLPGVG